MSQTSFSSEVTLATLGNYIKKDGTTTTTASIPFAEGLSIGSIPSGFLGSTAKLNVYTEDEAGPNWHQIIFSVTDETTPGLYGGVVYMQAGRGPEGGGAFFIYGGPSNVSGISAGSTQIYGGSASLGGNSGSVVLAGGSRSGAGNVGYVRVGASGVTNRFTLSSDDTRNSLYVTKHLEVDGTAYFDSSVYLTSLTGAGILKIDSNELVAVASASDILSAIGTIDISDDTNLAVSSPITLTDDTIGFDATANFSWSGTHTFTNASGVTISAASPALNLTDSGGDDWIISVNSGTFQLTNVSDLTTVMTINPTTYLMTHGGSITANTVNLAASSAQLVFDSTNVITTTLQDSAATISKTLTLPNVSATLAHIGSASQIFAGLCTFSSTSGIILSSTSPSITFTDTTGSEDDFVFSTVSGGFRLNNSTDSVIALEVSGAGVNTYNAANGQYHVFNVNNSEELRIAANRMTFNNGATDTYIDWSNSGRLDIGGGGYTFINAGAIIASSAITPHATSYELSVQSTGAASYLEILNGYGTGAGMFFGIAGSGAEGDAAEIWNYQGGPLHVYTAPTAGDGTTTFKVSEDGYAGIQTGKRFYLEMDSSGNFGDTYLEYNSGSSKVRLYVNGALAQEWS